MKYLSEFSGKTYRDSESIWIWNTKQIGRMLKHGAIPIDIVSNKKQGCDDFAVIFDREQTEEMRRLWDEYRLPPK